MDAISARVLSESGDVHLEHVHVKWKPDWRFCWRVVRGSSGDVSILVSLRRDLERRLNLHDIVISSPSAMGLVACTVWLSMSVSITYCALVCNVSDTV